MGFETRGEREHARAQIGALALHETYSSFAAIPSNLRAVENSLLFAVGESPYCVMFGPSGWGKSSLIEAMSRLCAAMSGKSPICMPSADILRRHRTLDPARPLVLEDVQESFCKQKDKFVLQHLLERRIRAKRPTFLVLTSEPSTGELRRALPYFQRWAISRIGTPTTPERRIIAHLMAEREGLRLADPLLSLLSSKLNGNGLSLSGALKRLRLAGEAWITDEEILRACGVLNPFFEDNGSFDLRHTICDCASDSVELAAHLMLKVSHLPEDAVARQLEMSPSEVFRMANRVTRRLGQSDELRAQARELQRLVVKEIG